jgi:hypothetical protein
VLPFASYEPFTQISDKALLLDAAPEWGSRCRRSSCSRAPGEVPDSRSIRFPLVLKPARSVARGGGLARRLV